MFEATAIVQDLAVCSLITAESAIWKSALQYFHFRFFNFPFGKGKSLAFYHVFLRFDMRFLSRSLSAKSKWKVFFPQGKQGKCIFAYVFVIGLIEQVETVDF